MLLHGPKWVASDDHHLQVLEVPGTDQIVLILDDVVAEVEMFQFLEVASDKVFSVDPAEIVSGDVQVLHLSY